MNIDIISYLVITLQLHFFLKGSFRLKDGGNYPSSVHNGTINNSNTYFNIHNTSSSKGDKDTFEIVTLCVITLFK